MNKSTRSLIIDKGNTKTKLAIFEGRELIEILPEGFPILEIQGIINDKNIDRILISSVGGSMSSITKNLKNIEILELTSETSLPIKIDYETPNTLGVDRIANACAASVLFEGENVLVIDAGSCITYDMLNGNKTFIGGAISPGLKMRIQAMNNFTADLPLVEIVNLPSSLGKSTLQCLQSGVYFGILSEIEGFIELYQELGKDLKVILTGGDNSYFEKELKYPIFAHPNLTLKGLNEILLYNMA